MMGDHKLSDKQPDDEDVPYVKRFIISLKAEGDEPVGKLWFRLEGLTTEDGIDKPGSTAGTVTKAMKLVDELLGANRSEVPFIPGTPLDFDIKEKCMIALKLSGDFWQFATDNAIKTKKQFSTGRYYGLGLEFDNKGRAACAYFCSKKPKETNSNNGINHKHGINLYIEFMQQQGGETLRLPVIIDPDIENKGKG